LHRLPCGTPAHDPEAPGCGHHRGNGCRAGADSAPLVELWRTAPYLHDGSAATLRDIFRARNPQHLHGDAHLLTDEEFDDLMAFLASL
jgi:cytochrome c peroxidase